MCGFDVGVGGESEGGAGRRFGLGGLSILPFGTSGVGEPGRGRVGALGLCEGLVG